MEESRLGPAIWRIEVYDIRGKIPFTGYIADLSNFYTSDLKIKRQRNYPDEVTFTLDLYQLQERAASLGIADPHQILEPYMHKVKIYRNNNYICQAIVTKTSVNLSNNPASTIEVSCVDILGILEKRLIHQDYGEGSWADFAKEVVMDAQHEPNRIYNYAFEGDGTAIDNVWFRGWQFIPGEETRKLFPDWEPNRLYSMYDRCNYGGKFWEAKEHAFYSGETFSESNWTLLGILDDETGETQAAYAVWREDDEDAGPTGTSFGGWGGTSSCHMTAQTFSINNGGKISGIDMAGSSISTSLVSPFLDTVDSGLIHTRVMARNAKQIITINDSVVSQTGNIIKSFDPVIAQSAVVTRYANQIPEGESITNFILVYEETDDAVNFTFTIGVTDGTTIEAWNKAIKKARTESGTTVWDDLDIDGLRRLMRLLGVEPDNFDKDPDESVMIAYIDIDASSSILPSTCRLFLEGYAGERSVYSPTMDLESNTGWQNLVYDFPVPDFQVYRFGIQILSGDIIFDTPLCYALSEEGDVWDLGLRIGVFPTDQEQASVGWKRNRHTPTYEWKNAKSTLLDLSNMDSDNFWYSVDENYMFNLYANAGSDKIKLELSYPRNITNMVVSTNANDIVNYIKGDGSAEVKQDPLVSGLNVFNSAPFTWIGKNKEGMEKYWALASAVKYDSERDIDSLQTDIESEIATFADIQDVPEIKIANNTISPEDVAIGDIVSVEAIDVPYVQRANGLYKITAYSIQVDMNGNESISLTLLKPNQTQINALAFPQLIKNLMLRLGGKR